MRDKRVVEEHMTARPPVERELARIADAFERFLPELRKPLAQDERSLVLSFLHDLVWTVNWADEGSGTRWLANRVRGQFKHRAEDLHRMLEEEG